MNDKNEFWWAKPWWRGYYAYLNGYVRTENPYSIGSNDAKDWEDGWVASYLNELTFP